MQQELSEYEKLRQHKILENQKVLSSLGISSLITTITTTAEEDKRTLLKRKSNDNSDSKAKKVKNTEPTRNSSRLRGIPPPNIKRNLKENSELSNSVDAKLFEDSDFLSCEEYCKSKNIIPKCHSDGVYKGSVKPELAEAFGIQIADKQDKFVKKSENKTEAFKSAKSKGWSNAKAMSKTLLHTNPNAYFYRHVAPGVEQWMGDWSEEELQLFIHVAKEFGCGDKWGLFSSYIPHRVGYQCSNFYRQYVIPNGHITDPNYVISPDGRAIFKGKKNKNK